MINTKEIGKRIRYHRKNRNPSLGQSDFAEIVGINQQRLSQIENGRNPATVEQLAEIAAALNLSLDYLVLGKTTDPIELTHIKALAKKLHNALEDYSK